MQIACCGVEEKNSLLVHVRHDKCTHRCRMSACPLLDPKSAGLNSFKAPCLLGCPMK